MLKYDSQESVELSITTIRQNFRKSIRNQCIQKKFKETRIKLMAEQSRERQRKIQQHPNQFINTWNINNDINNEIEAEVSPIRVQNYHQNLCQNGIIGSSNGDINKNIRYLNVSANNAHYKYNNLNDTQIKSPSPCKQLEYINYPNAHHQPIINIQVQQQLPYIPLNNYYHNIQNNNVNNNYPINKNHINPINQNNCINKPRQNNQNYNPKQNSNSPISISPATVQKHHKILFKYKNYLVYSDILGSGTYAKVYLGLDLITNTKVAIKQISEMEENEIKVLMSIHSPYIVRLQSFWKNTQKNLTYLVLELCQRNLREELKTGITIQQKIRYYQQVINGIDVLFSRNIIHRDLKFENILVSKQKIAKITDFGLAKDMGLMSNVASIRCGTPYTMAPEIFFNNGFVKPYYNQKCDIWSLGVILHQIIYGKHPFNYQSERMMRMERVQIDKKNGYLDILIDKSLVKDPNQRISWNQFRSIFNNKGYVLPNKLQQTNQIYSCTNFKKKKELNNSIFQLKQPLQHNYVAMKKQPIYLPTEHKQFLIKNQDTKQLKHKQIKDSQKKVLPQNENYPERQKNHNHIQTQVKILQKQEIQEQKKQKEVQQLPIKGKEPSRFYNQINNILSNLVEEEQASKKIKPSCQPLEAKLKPIHIRKQNRQKNNDKIIKIFKPFSCSQQYHNKYNKKQIEKGFAKRKVETLVPGDIFNHPVFKIKTQQKSQVGQWYKKPLQNNHIKIEDNNKSQLFLKSMFVAVFVFLLIFIINLVSN